jgi:hypothetical protein
MKQEDWIRIMLESICDQTIRASKSANRMAKFFERRGEIDKADRLKRASCKLADVLKDVEIYDEG